MINRVYDAGALLAADAGEQKFWKEHKTVVSSGHAPLVPAAVIAQVSRARPRQVNLSRLLRDCTVVQFDEETGYRVGALLAASKTSDVVDASVVVAAYEHDVRVILTSDIGDIEHLVNLCGTKIHVMRPVGLVQPTSRQS